MAMHNPPHPGTVIKEEILEPLHLSISELARGLAVNRKRLSLVLRGKSPLTPELAIRLEMAFKPSAESWIRQQAAYDLWQARQKSQDLHITPFAGYRASGAH
jgi:addiction module HigA family antidote